jgi:hypothetical protein
MRNEAQGQIYLYLGGFTAVPLRLEQSSRGGGYSVVHRNLFISGKK